MTHWILQNNIYSEDGWEALVGALDRLGYSYSVHKCVPFEGTLDPEPAPPPGPVIVMGSYTMANHAKKRGWSPGAWLDNLDFRVQWREWYRTIGDVMLNSDAFVCKFGDVPEMLKPFFIRPVHDSKAFTGMVVDWEYYTKWRDGIVRMGPEPDFGLHTEVMVCSKKEIYSETRTWIVGGKVVTASGYKLGTIKRYSPPDMVEARVTDFAQDCADAWSPNEAYVLDVADTPDGLRIVEVNNLNSAGFYKADMVALAGALEALVEKHGTT